jgi:tripartite-type tricarboxylate transporter receptor subunit TctC
MRLAHAQQPDLLKLLVPFPAGGALDSLARIFSDSYRTATGRRCVVENRPGASTIIASSEVSRAKPDGSVLLWMTGGHTTNAVLVRKLPYDSIADFTPVSMLFETDGFVLLTRSKSDYNSIRDVIDAAKRSPGKLTYGSAGNGNTTHVVGALFARSAGIDIVHVPYKGTPLTDLIAGHIDITFVAPSAVMQYINAGQLKALGISGKKRGAMLPNVPTFAEFGLDSVDVPAWFGLLAPPRMEPAILDSTYRDVLATLRNPAFAARMKELGNEALGTDPNKFKAYIADEIARYKRLLPPLGIEMDV